MDSNEAQIFLALAVKNRFLDHDTAARCLKQAQQTGQSVIEFVRGRNLIPAEKIAMLEAAIQQVRKGQTGTVRILKPLAPANPAEPIPGYNIVGKLGVGGTATVFLAEDRRNEGRKVALKIIKPTVAKEEKTLKGFLREAELLTRFEHPNLVRGYDYGSAGPLTYLVLEFLDGEPVLDILDREGPLSEARAMEIILEAGKAVGYIQSQGIIHRDIKPENLIATKDGRIILCDLGFAVPITGEPDRTENEESTTSGTVQYMSPEQARGQSDLDFRSDIYSLGATLYHMIMGKVPFAGDDSYEVMAKQVLESLNSSEMKNRRVSRHMHYFIERMMSKDKDLRYPSPAELVEDITAQIEGFRSLEYRPDTVQKEDSVVLRGLRGGEEKKSSTTRIRMRDRKITRFRKRRGS